jgi:hypothetical protein
MLICFSEQLDSSQPGSNDTQKRQTGNEGYSHCSDHPRVDCRGCLRRSPQDQQLGNYAALLDGSSC